MTKQFKVGKTYATRSICDYDTIFRFKVIARTAKQVTLQKYSDGQQRRRGVYVYEGVEQCKPYGTYSMCPILGADDAEAT